MTGAEIGLDNRIKPLFGGQVLCEIQLMGNGSIQSQSERFKDQMITRSEVGVKTTMRQIRELHQIGHTQAIDAILAQAEGSILDNASAGLLPMIVRGGLTRLSELPRCRHREIR